MFRPSDTVYLAAGRASAIRSVKQAECWCATARSDMNGPSADDSLMSRSFICHHHDWRGLTFWYQLTHVTVAIKHV